MNYRWLGETGLQVSTLSFGTINFGRPNADLDDLSRGLAIAVDRGVNLIDTADAYSQGQSELLLGKLLAQRTDRDRLIIATKFFNQIGDDINNRGGGRRWIRKAVEGSLRRLGIEHIDLYQMHRPDPNVPIDETLAALTELVNDGKIRHFGTTTFNAHELTEAHLTARLNGRIAPSTEQLPYSILVRHVERDVLPAAAKYRIGVLAWSPLAGGWLTGAYDYSGTSVRGQRQPERHSPGYPENQAKRAAVEQLKTLAGEWGLPLSHVALAFVLANKIVTSVLIGPRTAAHVIDLLRVAHLTLEDSQLDAIDQIVRPGVTINPADTGFSHNHLDTLVAAQRRGTSW